MRKTWLLVVFSFLLLASVQAVDVDRETQKQSTTFDYQIYYSTAPDCVGVACNITIFYPNNTLMLTNIQLTANSGYANITIPGTRLNDLGIYDCALAGPTPSINYKCNFEITPTGFASNENEGIIGAVVIILLFGIGAVLLFFSNIYAETKAWWVFGFVGIAVGLLIFYYDLLLAIVYLKNIAYSAQTYENFEFLFYLAARLQKWMPYLFMACCLLWWYMKRRSMKKTVLGEDGWDGEDTK